MNEGVLAFENVSFSYEKKMRSVLPDFSLSITEGSITAILGPNGAGKSTLLYLALGWLKPQQGRILLAGRDLRTYTRRESGMWMGLVPQSEHIAFDFSMLEYTLLGRAPYMPPLAMPGEEDVRAAREALEQVGMGNMLDRSVLNLSGGERQLMLTARAIAQQPKVLLLDEPTSHLDLNNKVRLLNILRSLSAQGVSIVLTTHEPEFASAIATDLVLMRDGRIQEAGSLSTALTSEKLTRLYGTPVKVVEVDGRCTALWG